MHASRRCGATTRSGRAVAWRRHIGRARQFCPPYDERDMIRISETICWQLFHYCSRDSMRGSAIFNGVFELREGVSEEEFLPTLVAFYEHFIELGFASGYRILRPRGVRGLR